MVRPERILQSSAWADFFRMTIALADDDRAGAYEYDFLYVRHTKSLAPVDCLQLI